MTQFTNFARFFTGSKNPKNNRGFQGAYFKTLKAFLSGLFYYKPSEPLDVKNQDFLADDIDQPPFVQAAQLFVDALS